THDVQESLKIVDYLYFVADGVIITEGTPDEIKSSDKPFVQQFINGEMDGPVPFHYPGGDYQQDLKLKSTELVKNNKRKANERYCGLDRRQKK
ncbi:MAG: hypothetical protein ABL865_05630, partial [Candidatus Nitrotoga sp.]